MRHIILNLKTSAFAHNKKQKKYMDGKNISLLIYMKNCISVISVFKSV